MYELTTTIELPIAHRLEMAYDSLCTGQITRAGLPSTSKPVVHGHNYMVTVTLKAEHLDQYKMVMDFKQFKKTIHEVLDMYDHSLILKNTDPMVLDYYKDQPASSRLFVWDENPTAEVMAKKFFEELVEVLKNRKIVVTVEETAHNKVCYYE